MPRIVLSNMFYTFNDISQRCGRMNLKYKPDKGENSYSNAIKLFFQAKVDSAKLMEFFKQFLGFTGDESE
jgi:hypothetical protein